HSESLGISFKIDHIRPFILIYQFLPDISERMEPEKIRYGLFTGMSKWWIPDIVSQCGCGHDGTNITGCDINLRQLGVFVQQKFPLTFAQRPSYTGNL